MTSHSLAVERGAQSLRLIVVKSIGEFRAAADYAARGHMNHVHSYAGSRIGAYYLESVAFVVRRLSGSHANRDALA